MNRTTAEVLLLLLMTGGAAVQAGEAGAPAGDPPSMELLEFLGGFETPEGEWFDPLLLVDRQQNQTDPKVTGDD